MKIYQEEILCQQGWELSTTFEQMNLSNQTDTEVYSALQSGNQQALGVIYDRYGDAVYRLALRMLGNKTEAEDLTQEVFLAFWKGANYDPNRGSMVVFLMTITRSRAINRLNQKRSQQQLTERFKHSVPEHYVNNTMEKATFNEIQQRVAEALKELPDSQRQILEMAYYDGLSQSQITEQLNIPLGTVKTRSRQGLLKLRKLLNDLVE
jgi:RNA polymerase sigma-70 factor, ECF subfamily